MDQVDVDLRGMPFMPLDVARLRDSDLAIMATGDEFRAAVLLWCAAWNQLPAASLPDNDQALAAYAGFGRDVRGWLAVKPGAMRGFVVCSDGRWYHPVVAEKAVEAWAERKEYRAGKEHDNDRKRREREWRSLAFKALRAVGISPVWNIRTGELRKLLERYELQVVQVDKQCSGGEGDDDSDDCDGMERVTPPVTPPVTGTGHGHVTAKTGTGTGTGTDISTPDRSQQAPEISEGATLAGQACLLMRRAGCHTTNPSHPDLLAALGEGVTPQALGDTVTEGLSRAPPVAKPFAWAITTARARHAEGPKQPPQNTGTHHGTRRLAPADQVEQFIRAREQGGNVIDATSAIAARHGSALEAHGSDLRTQVDEWVYGGSGGGSGEDVVEGSFRVVGTANG
ncbi:DUF1376 domain-containing protein [Stenotrophomonas sp. CFBP 13725]|uniref:DUF1376 domain-containing protein n=1 Tax=Stenotrophomonas sp. CFBP 13725 TaxID=2775297 RepID=UPI00201760EC|nr:DUF1376 domain-containing protein [Stenotrophomonas sp. CFBP 13725]